MSTVRLDPNADYTTLKSADLKQDLSNMSLAEVDDFLREVRDKRDPQRPAVAFYIPVRQGLTRDVKKYLKGGQFFDPFKKENVSFLNLLYENVDTIGYVRHLQKRVGQKWRNIRGAFSSKPQKGYKKVVIIDTFLEKARTQSPETAVFSTLVEEAAHAWIHSLIQEGLIPEINKEEAPWEYNAKVVKLSALQYLHTLKYKNTPAERQYKKVLGLAKRDIEECRKRILEEYKGRASNLEAFPKKGDYSIFFLKIADTKGDQNGELKDSASLKDNNIWSGSSFFYPETKGYQSNFQKVDSDKTSVYIKSVKESIYAKSREEK